MSESRTLCAVAKYALGASNPSGENNGVNCAWCLMLEAIDSASGVKVLRSPGAPDHYERKQSDHL